MFEVVNKNFIITITLIEIFFKGILLATSVSNALKGTRQKFKIATTSTTTTSTEDPQTEGGEGDDVEVS